MPESRIDASSVLAMSLIVSEMPRAPVRAVLSELWAIVSAAAPAMERIDESSLAVTLTAPPWAGLVPSLL